jgi:hypothetical protein
MKWAQKQLASGRRIISTCVSERLKRVDELEPLSLNHWGKNEQGSMNESNETQPWPQDQKPGFSSEVELEH